MNGRSGIKVRYDKDFEKQCYDLMKLFIIKMLLFIEPLPQYGIVECPQIYVTLI